MSSLSLSVCTNDIAFVVLDRALDLPLAPIRIRLPTSRGELVKLVGYGSDGTNDVVLRDSPRRRLEHQAVVRVGPDSVEDGVTTTPPRTVVFGGPASCRGDSGGPALSETTGAVVGVFSLLQRADCLDPEIELYYTHTSPFERLARDAFAAAAEQPRFEENRALGEPCTEKYHCKSGRCVAPAEGEPVCAEPCDDRTCPAGFECDTSGAEPLCVLSSPAPSPDSGVPIPAPATVPSEGGCNVAVAPIGTGSASWLGVAMLGALLVRRRPRNEQRRRRSAVRWCFVPALALAFGGCGDDEVVFGGPPVDGGGASGAAGSGGNAGRAGASGAAGMDAAAGSAGSGQGDGSAGTGGTAGRDGAAGSGGSGAGDAGDGATNTCKPDSGSYMLEVCKRFTTTQWRTAAVQSIEQFVPKVSTDCRVARLLRDHPRPQDYIQRVHDWSVLLWGCGDTGVTTFGLTDVATAVSSADVRVLIDHYMSVVTVRLSLSSEEDAQMRRALECLGAGVVTNSSTTEHELSNCPVDAGADSSPDTGVDGDGVDAATDDAATDDAGDGEAE